MLDRYRAPPQRREVMPRCHKFGLGKELAQSTDYSINRGLVLPLAMRLLQKHLERRVSMQQGDQVQIRLQLRSGHRVQMRERTALGCRNERSQEHFARWKMRSPRLCRCWLAPP